jgi:hypothetical protein
LFVADPSHITLGQFVAFELGLEVMRMAALGVQEVRVTVVALQEPQRAGAQAERVLDVEHGDRGCIQPEVARTQCAMGDVGDDRIQQVDRSATRRSERVRRQRHAVRPCVALHAFPGHAVSVMVDERLHDQLVAEHAAVDDFVRSRCVDDVLVTALASNDLGSLLDHDEAGGSQLELLALLDGHVGRFDVAVRTHALRLRNAAVVAHTLQVRRQLRAAVWMRSLGTALLGLLLLRLGAGVALGALDIVSRLGSPERQLHLQTAHRLARRSLAPRGFEPSTQLGVQVAHARHQYPLRGPRRDVIVRRREIRAHDS